MKRLIAYTSLLILSMNKIYAFDLFDPERGKAPPPPTVVEQPKPKEEPKPPPVNPFAAPPKPPPVQRDFVLRGISRIGNIYKIILQPPDGKPAFIQNWKPQEVNKIKGFSDFILLNVESREVKISYPEESCLKNNSQIGVTCSSDNKVATLELVARDAIPVAVAPQQPETPPPPNPFALAAMSAANNVTPEELAKREEEIAKRREVYQSFQRQVIKDEDVPPGMRVVRTPFGDRLVPDNGEPDAPSVRRNQRR